MQTDSRLGGGSQATSVQTDSIIGLYDGPLALPYELRLRRVIEAVVGSPDMTVGEVARQLATSPHWRMEEDQSLGLLEAVAAAIAGTTVYIQERLRSEADRSLFHDPSGGEVLTACSQYLDNLRRRD